MSNKPNQMQTYDPAQLGIADRYKLMIGGIVPRPIGFISTVSPEGRHNLAPYSFFTGVGSNPMMLMFCPANEGDGSIKGSMRNALPRDEGGTGEFVVNVASERYERLVSVASEPLPHGESEFELTGLTPAACKVVSAPRVAESPLAYECRTTQVVRTNPGAPAGGNVVIGEVVAVWVEDGLVNERFHIDADRLAVVGRMGGLAYSRTRDRFDLPRGRAAL